ncbi:MAG: glycosyltransferase, partial [Actinomycetota bacterium]|nr:glycosyltransferase [Actinomycetota bacterium]
MKIGIVTPVAPGNVVGGAERLWHTLQRRLAERGHDVELVAIPTPESNLAEVLESYETFLHLDVSRFDVVITGKYPAWMIRHPRHLVYLLHPLRGLYDTYPDTLPVDDDPSISAATSTAGSAAELLATIRELSQQSPDRTAFPGRFA